MAVPDRTDLDELMDHAKDTQPVGDEESVETSRFSCNCIRNFREMALP